MLLAAKLFSVLLALALCTALPVAGVTPAALAHVFYESAALPAVCAAVF